MGVQQITERIFANVEYIGGNVACIDTEQGLVLVDTPTLPGDVFHWKEFTGGLNPEGARYIINTHHHFDHVLGNHRLGGRVIMHETAGLDMFEEGGTMRETVAPVLAGTTREDLDFILSEPLIPPEITFSDHMSIYLGNLTLRLFHLGGHTRGSICVYAEEDKVLMTGDNVTAEHHPFKGQGNFAEWIKALRWMKSLDIETIVPGHGEVCRPDELDRLLEYFTRLWYLAEDLIRKGLGREEVIKEVRRLMIGYYQIEPEMLEGAKMMFDIGTSRLYDEILARL